MPQQNLTSGIFLALKPPVSEIKVWFQALKIEEQVLPFTFLSIFHQRGTDKIEHRREREQISTLIAKSIDQNAVQLLLNVQYQIQYFSLSTTDMCMFDDV